MFDPQNLDNDTKINTAIKQNFTCKITEPLPEYCHYVKLPDVLNFSRVDFDKTISLNSKLQVAETLQSINNSEYEMKKIDKVLTLEYEFLYLKTKELMVIFLFTVQMEYLEATMNFRLSPLHNSRTEGKRQGRSIGLI